MPIPYTQWKAQKQAGNNQQVSRPAAIPYTQYKASKQTSPESPFMRAAKVVGNVGIGALKGLPSTIYGGAKLLEKAISPISAAIAKPVSEAITGKPFVQPPPIFGKKPEILEAQGTAQKVGFGLEQAGEFLAIPESKIAEGLKIADVGIEGLKLADKYGKAGRAAEAILKLGTRGIRGATQLGAGTAIQTGGNVEAAKKAALFGGITVPLGEIAKSTLPEIARSLEKANLRLTPVQKQNLGSKLDRISNFILEKNIIGTPEMRYAKADKLYNDSERTLQNFLNKEAKDKFISKNEFLSKLEGLKSNYQNERDVLAIEKQIDEAKLTIKSKYQDEIPVNRLNQFKRSTYKNAYNKAGSKVLDDVEHSIGDVTKKSIEDATKGLKMNGKDIGDFNKEYGNIIEAKKLLKIAKSRPQLGLTGRIISMIVGGAIGEEMGGGIIQGAVGAAVGSQLGEVIAGTPTRSLISSGLSKLAKSNISKATPAETKGLLELLKKKEE